MAVAPHHHLRHAQTQAHHKAHPKARHSVPVALTLTWRGVHHTWRLGRIGAAILMILIPLAAVWYAGTAAYFIFHDRLVAALIARQADLQYAYEDQISGLRTQLDREASRAMVDRQTLSTTVRDLAARSAQLEARAQTIDRLVQDLTGTDKIATPDTQVVVVPPADPATGAAGPGSAPLADAPSEDHSELAAPAPDAALSANLGKVETRQINEIAALRDPILHDVVRMQTALAETGLPLTRWRKQIGNVGGPFVPVPQNASDFDKSFAALQDALAERLRLRAVVASVPLRKPIEGRIEITSPFGVRADPFFGRAAMHTGMDLLQPYGGPVYATAAGVVVSAGPDGGYGNMVEISHGNGLTTRYAHLSSIDVAPHQQVTIGTLVGHVGSTGRSTGPHLHYETRIDGEAVDPTRFLRAGMYLSGKR